jgi:hypothetical protein
VGQGSGPKGYHVGLCHAAGPNNIRLSLSLNTQNSEPPSIALTMSGDSKASFSQSVMNTIRGIYHYRCVICLYSVGTTQCAHLLDAATLGAHQVRSKAMV